MTATQGQPNWPSSKIVTSTSSKGGSSSIPAAALFSAWMVFRYTVETRLELVNKDLLPLDPFVTQEDPEGYLHHESLPAWKTKYETEYYSHGYAHRTSGPAIINRAAGTRYFLYGVSVDEQFHKKVIEIASENDIPFYIAYCLVRMKDEEVPNNISDLVELPVNFAVKALGADVGVIIGSEMPFEIIAEDERVKYIATH